MIKQITSTLSSVFVTFYDVLNKIIIDVCLKGLSRLF